MYGATMNITQWPCAVMGLVLPILQPSAPPSWPESLRQELVDGLHVANTHLREIARAVRSASGPRANFERAIAAAWSNLATIERAAGLEGIVSKASSTRRILVVDDNADMRFLLTRTLKTIAPQAIIETASDATQAIALLEDAGPGDGLTVISDHDMGPGPTGIDLLATVAARHPKSHRVLFTGHPQGYFEGCTVDAHALLSKDHPNALRHYFGAP